MCLARIQAGELSMEHSPDVLSQPCRGFGIVHSGRLSAVRQDRSQRFCDQLVVEPRLEHVETVRRRRGRRWLAATSFPASLRSTSLGPSLPTRRKRDSLRSIRLLRSSSSVHLLPSSRLWTEDNLERSVVTGADESERRHQRRQLADWRADNWIDVVRIIRDIRAGEAG